MWHIEDLIRACNFEYTIVQQKLISGYKADATLIREISDWYQDLIHAMIREKITASGHFQFIYKLIDELNNLHLNLLKNTVKNQNYLKYYNAAKPNIELFRTKSDNQSNNDIEICLNALYSLLLLKLSKKEISQDTLESMNSFSNLLSLLSASYKKQEENSQEI